MARYSPVLVKFALDLIAEMLCPHCVQRPEASGSRDVADNAHHDHGRRLDDSHSLRAASAVSLWNSEVC